MKSVLLGKEIQKGVFVKALFSLQHFDHTGLIQKRAAEQGIEP